MINLNTRKYKTYLVLNIINQYGSISRTKLAEITEFRPATITELIKDLLAKNLIKEEGFSNTGRGRNQILLEINNDYLCAVGISIEPDNITYIVSTVNGQILKKVDQEISKKSKPEQITDMISSQLLDLINEFKDRHILGIGIGDPGLVDATGEYSVFSSQLKMWQNIPLKSIVKKVTDLPVKIERNDNLKALGENKYGFAKGYNDFICVQLGEGIGISIVANGAVVKGGAGAAGEMGHTVITSQGKICACGSYACVETQASLNVIISEIKSAILNGASSAIKKYAANVNNITVENIKSALKENDKLCMNIIEHAASIIGTALSNVINILNPELLIFSGTLIELGEPFLEAIKNKVNRSALSIATANLEFKISELKDLSAPLGAVTMIFDEFFLTDYFGVLCSKYINDDNMFNNEFSFLLPTN